MKKMKKYHQLMAAIKSKSVKDCKTLIDSKADVNYIFENKSTAFQYACQEGNTEIIKLLIEANANINVITRYGFPLLIAVKAKNLPILPLLIRHHADVNISFKGVTPLFQSCRNELNAAVLYLLAANPKPDLTKTFTSMKITVLHLACFNGYLKIAQALINAKADLNVEDGEGLTPLRTAFKAKRPAIVSYLAEINPYSLSSNQLHEQIHELANALKEFTGLYKRDRVTDEFYLPHHAFLHFASPLLTRMAGAHLDPRGIADEKFQNILRQSAGQAKYYWMQLINILSQPQMPNRQLLTVSAQLQRLAITYATWCQIAEANEAKHSTIRLGTASPIIINHSLLAIAREWRHRGLSLEEAGKRLGDQVGLSQKRCVSRDLIT